MVADPGRLLGVPAVAATRPSFELIDRIDDLVPERSARGRLAVPADMERFPACLVVEAIGQLAMWVAMLRADFEKRPVAAKAGDVRVLGVVHPGDLLELEIEAKSCKNLAIAYAGEARVSGRTVVELREAAGAMMPMALFDAPAAARARFAAMRGEGLPPRRFPDRADFAPRIVSRTDAADRIVAELEAPPPGGFYDDHFPLRPVYPATLLLDAQLRIATDLLPGAPVDPSSREEVLVGAELRGIAVRSFTEPGGRVTMQAERVAGEAGETAIEVSARAGDKRVSSARLVVAGAGAGPARRARGA